MHKNEDQLDNSDEETKSIDKFFNYSTTFNKKRAPLAPIATAPLKTPPETPIPPPRLSLLSKPKSIREPFIFNPSKGYAPPPPTNKPKNTKLPPIEKKDNSIENKNQSNILVSDMQKLNNVIDDECIICMENDANCSFVDCGHRITCSKCAHGIKTCPYCSKVVKRINFYF
jgi:hypothetical protein